MKRSLTSAALLTTVALAAGVMPAAAQDFPTGDVAFTLWTKEGEADGSFQYVQKLATDYSAVHPNVTITVVNKAVEVLREDFLTSSLAGNAPELLWTVADHVGPFTASNTIMPLNDVVDAAAYLPNSIAAVTAGDQLWGVPISYGNHLMLFWNKDMVPEWPADSAALVEAAKANTDAAAGNYGLVFNQTESFWLVPFLGGFGGTVFAEDGITPTLDTEAMVKALTFLHGLKYADAVTPAEADYDVADGLFKSGKAAMIINGDWTVGAYADAFGDKLGLGPLPPLVGGDYPQPYTAGSFYMVSKAVADDADKLAVIKDFMAWSTAKDQQVAMVETLRRLPTNNEAIADPVVTGDPYLAGSAEAVVHGIPQPTNLEMRCVFDSMTAGVRDLFASADADPAAIAATMQSGAEAGVAPGGECGPA